jgi:hypothetical protein
VHIDGEAAVQDFAELAGSRVVLLAAQDPAGGTRWCVAEFIGRDSDHGLVRVSRRVSLGVRSAKSVRIAPCTVFGRPTSSDQPVAVSQPVAVTDREPPPPRRQLRLGPGAVRVLSLRIARLGRAREPIWLRPIEEPDAQRPAGA